MWYETKRAILEAYGKDWKNVRWLDKAIQRGFVVEQDGMYAFKRDVQWDDIRWLKEEIEQLRKENATLKKNNNSSIDLLDHLKFFYKMDLARKGAMENMVRAYFNNKPADWWEAAEEKAYKVMKFSPNPYEADEIEYVKGLIE
jgi:hypothetical protein